MIARMRTPSQPRRAKAMSASVAYWPNRQGPQVDGMKKTTRAGSRPRVSIAVSIAPMVAGHGRHSPPEVQARPAARVSGVCASTSAP